MTITILKDSVRLLSSLGERFIADNDEHALCYVACHSDDVFLSLATWYCAMCHNSTWVSVLLLIPSHCDELMYTSTQQRLNAFLNARVIVLYLCRALKPN